MLIGGGKWIVGVGFPGMVVPEGRARSRRSDANDSRTKFPISGKVLLGWHVQSYGFELGLAMPVVLGGLVFPMSATTRGLGLAKPVPAFDAAHDPSTKSLRWQRLPGGCKLSL